MTIYLAFKADLAFKLIFGEHPDLVKDLPNVYYYSFPYGRESTTLNTCSQNACPSYTSAKMALPNKK